MARPRDPLTHWKNIAWGDESKPKEVRERLVQMVIQMNLVDYVPMFPYPLQIALRGRQELEGLIGGEPRGSKTWGLLIDNVCDTTVEGFTAIFFRRTKPELERKNGLIDTLRQWFAPFPEWHWSQELFEWRNTRYNSALTFAFLGQKGDEDNLFGVEFQSMNYEEITRMPFTAEWNPYSDLFHRLNVPLGMPVKKRVRATANPGGDNEKWVMDYFLSPNAERFDTGGDGSYLLVQRPRPDSDPKKDFGGIFYLHAQIEDNKSVNAHSYRASIARTSEITQQQMGEGLWGVVRKGGVIDTSKIRPVPSMPWNVLARTRNWDKASSEMPKSMEHRKRQPPRTAGVRISRLAPGMAERMWGREFAMIEFVIEHGIAGYWTPGPREDVIDRIAGGGFVPIRPEQDVWWAGDGFQTIINHEQEPGSGGLESAQQTSLRLIRRGYTVNQVRAVFNKETRAAPFASAVARGMYGIVTDGTWDHEEYLGELMGFPKQGRKDFVDATSLGHAQLVQIVPDTGAMYAIDIPPVDMSQFRPFDNYAGLDASNIASMQALARLL